MMKLYAVRDCKADSFGAPMSIASVGIARRVLLETAQQGNSPLAKYPEDFSLYELGEYDADSGEIRPCKPAPVFVATVLDILNEARAARIKTEPVLPGVEA